MPPVCPSPRPDILATLPPRHATTGATMSVVLSPTPPVECLSTDLSPKRLKSTVSPERIMASVSTAVSRSFIPRNSTAIANADI